jgi:hypothetical protein
VHEFTENAQDTGYLFLDLLLMAVEKKLTDVVKGAVGGAVPESSVSAPLP